MDHQSKCPSCNTSGFYTKKDGTRRCKKCGSIWGSNNDIPETPKQEKETNQIEEPEENASPINNPISNQNSTKKPILLPQMSPELYAKTIEYHNQFREKKNRIRDWNLINERQAKQDLYVWDLTSLAVDALNIPHPVNKNGRPPANHSDQIKLAILKVYNRSSYRKQLSFNMLYANAGYVNKLVKRTTISQVFTESSFTQYLEGIYRNLANFLIPFENSFAIDATGFSTRYNSRWVKVVFDFQKHKSYRKLHIICGNNTGIISEARVTDGTCADSPLLPELVKNTAKRFNMKRVCADAGYLGRENVQCIEDVQAKPFIMPKKGIKTLCKGHYPAWMRMIRLWREKPELFLKQYHLRSRVESVFSNMKTTLCDGINSKTETAQMNEILIRVICHNLSVIIEAIFRLGINPYSDG